MLDIRFIRDNAELLQWTADQKGVQLSIDSLLNLDHDRLVRLRQAEQKRMERNRCSQLISGLIQEEKPEEAERLKRQVRLINEELRPLEAELADLEQQFQELMLQVPNVVSSDTPVGQSDADNVEIRRFGAPPSFSFETRDHVEIGTRLELFDLAKGVKTAGTRGYYLTGAGVYLHRAVQQLAIDLLVGKGFILLDVPLLVREEAMIHTGFFPSGREQTYEIAGEDHWLAGTSEVPLVSYYSGEWIDVSQPVRLAAVSNCFRKEAGSAGRDVRGLYRVHQFAKVEQVVLCRNEPGLSEALHQEITANAEQLLQLLELPYRVVAVCTGDLSSKNYKQYDIETWMPGRGNYGETHSSSNLLDYQARRSNLRYKDEQGQAQYCHTLNNTAVASPRILIPLLENHQREDGSVHLPEALRKYMYEMTELR